MGGARDHGAGGKVGEVAVSLREAVANSTLDAPAEFATTNSLPKIVASKSRSMAQPCCTKAGADAIKSLHQKLTAQKRKLARLQCTRAH